MIGWTGLTSWEFEFPFPGSRYIYLPRGAYDLLGVNHDPLTNKTWGGLGLFYLLIKPSTRDLAS